MKIWRYFVDNIIVVTIVIAIIIITIMFNVISYRAEILLSLVFAVRADTNRHQPDVKGPKAISFPGYLTST